MTSVRWRRWRAGKASVSVAGLVDFRPRQEWVSFSNGKRPAGKAQLYMAMIPKTGQSDSPLNDLIEQVSRIARRHVKLKTILFEIAHGRCPWREQYPHGQRARVAVVRF